MINKAGVVSRPHTRSVLDNPQQLEVPPANRRSVQLLRGVHPRFSCYLRRGRGSRRYSAPRFEFHQHLSSAGGTRRQPGSKLLPANSCRSTHCHKARGYILGNNKFTASTVHHCRRRLREVGETATAAALKSSIDRKRASGESHPISPLNL